jgi:hypothetical protein
MRRKKAILAVLFILAAGLYLAAEVALDEVVQAGRFVLYRDHADAHKYYYVPDAPRLATKRDGTPEFAFIKYAKTDGETKGGIVHFLVTWGMSEGELSSAESALRLKDPEAKIAGPVPFKEGTFKVVSATAGEGGIFSRRIVGEGKAPIMPGQKAAVSIALTEEGASLLWESFKNPTSDISVMFDLRFTGVTPAFQAKLKVNWDKVYTQHDIKLHAEGQIKVVKLQADVRAILEELRQKGAIQLEVVGENENMQKMLDVVYTHLLSLMCEKVPMGPGEAASTPAIKRPLPAVVADWPACHPSWSLGVLAEVVRSADERLRGGPFWDQEQAQTQQTTAQAPCDAASIARYTAHIQDALKLEKANNFLRAAEKYKEAYAACPRPLPLFRTAVCLDTVQEFQEARGYYAKFLQESGEDLSEQRSQAGLRLGMFQVALPSLDAARQLFQQRDYAEAIGQYMFAFEKIHSLEGLYNAAATYHEWGLRTEDPSHVEQAIETFQRVAEEVNGHDAYVLHQRLDQLRMSSLRAITSAREDLERFRSARAAVQPEGQAAAAETARARAEQAQTQQATAEERRARRQQAQTGVTEQTAQEQAQTGAQAQAVKPPDTVGGGEKPPGAQATAQAGGTKPPAGGELTAAQIEQLLASGQSGKPPDTTGGTKPPTGQTGTTGAAATTPAAKPGAKAPEVKPIISVQIGYSFKRVKMSGNYEVDMRKRLREDRDIVMSGNIGGVYQKYGEDKRFFSIVSLDDPTFQERSIEVILDGQDASDFKNYINSVSVLFRKQRFSGAPMTGEVKFVDQQFAQSGNRLSFKYGRLNEASTEWLDYEYKPKWSFYGGVEWEGDWTKTSDSVLTLSPPVRRRTLEISVDEDNILKNAVKALAIQIKHQIYGKDILKEVVINYDKGDPLQADYTYFHEDGNLGYSYKVVWLLLDGREVHTDWMAKESPFIYAVYTKK